MSDSPPRFIPWNECIAALDDLQLKLYSQWRGFSWKFCLQLRDQQRVGLYRDKIGTPCICYPIFGPGGAVIAEEVFTNSSDPNVPKSYVTAGAKGNISPVVLGPLPHATSIFLTEGGHDAFAYADRSGRWKDPNACFIATRGASNDRLLNGLPWPQPNGGPPPELVLLCQNDKTKGTDGLTANERWLKRVTPRLPFAYYRWNPPGAHKDFNDWTRAGVTEAELFDELSTLKTSTKPVDPAPSLIELLTPSEIKAYQPPPGFVLVGDYHIVRGNVFLIAGPPGVGKSRATVALGEAGATGYEWLGLKIHCRFSTIIIQNENGRIRLKQEFANLDETVLDKYVRISPPPPQGLCFGKEQFREELKKLFDAFPPAVVILDPWSAVSRDYTQKDYLESFELVQETIPKGDLAPALGIVPHTRKPRPDERTNRGRALLNTVVGSYVLTSIPRTVWVLQSASDLVTENRVVVTCAKNNDGDLGDRSVWTRDNGLWSPVTGFDWDAFDNPVSPGAKTGSSAITEQAMATVFDHGYKALKLAEAVAALMKLTGLTKSPCYRALDLKKGPFKKQLLYDQKTKLYQWIPT